MYIFYILEIYIIYIYIRIYMFYALVYNDIVNVSGMPIIM